MDYQKIREYLGFNSLALEHEIGVPWKEIEAIEKGELQASVDFKVSLYYLLSKKSKGLPLSFDQATRFKSNCTDKSPFTRNKVTYSILIVPFSEADLEKYLKQFEPSLFEDSTAKEYSKDGQYKVSAVGVFGSYSTYFDLSQ